MNPFGSVPLTRIEPQLPPHQVQSFQVRAPRSTHWRPATCAEAGCADYQAGWVTTVDEGTELGQKQAHYIRHDRTRGFTEERRHDGLTSFTFGPGQPCFASQPTGDGHRVRIERPEKFLRLGGDWRGNPRGESRVHHDADDWLDDFANHQDEIATAAGRG